MRRRTRADPLAPQRSWPIRTIALIADRADTDRICADWTAAGWQVLAVDVGEASPTGLPTHVVRVAVPPPGTVALAPAQEPSDGAEDLRAAQLG